MSKAWLVILGLTAATFAIRLSGVLLGQRLPQHGRWASALRALPGSLIVALVSVSLLSGGPREWAAGGFAAIAAVLTRSLLFTMGVGIVAIWVFRHYF
ncbi:MAG: AzlD domain-containing protein [Alphaproteobacteria bacterium]